MSDLIKKEATLESGTYVDREAGSVQNTSARVTWFEQFKELGRCRRTVAAAFACSSGAVLIGYDMTFIGSIIANEEFIKQFGLYDTNISTWILPANYQLVWSVVQYVAAMVGAFGIGLLSDRFGRRVCFYVTVSLTIAGTFVELFSPNWEVWVVAKVLMGAAMGFMQGNTPTYVSELTPVHIRGFMLSLFQFWIMLGSFLAACVLEGTSLVNGTWSWKGAIVSQFGLGAICLALFLPLVPESPYYLVRRGRSDAAREALLALHGKDTPEYTVESDLEMIQNTIEQEQEANQNQASYLQCLKGVNRRRTLIACLPMVMQMFAGYPLCGTYLAYFLTLSGISNSFLITVISILFAVLAVAVAFIMIEKVGRRPQLLFGAFAMLPCLLGISILGFVNLGTIANGRGLAALSILWTICYFLSIGAVGWTIVGEVSSVQLRAKTTSIAAAINSLFNMGWSIAIPYLINKNEANLGPKAGLIFLGTGTFFAFIAFFAIPETKNKTWAELDQLFEAHTPARKF
ncbi:High-affinity glucose transporter HXT2 [Talaromyces islandicus]|uniref:High-affinity glucose transporter HXT2 n=1 Tax=Talaromyces islandicus TaxID=28573 RepID=A0A0U1M9K1_TALIS|nr:High-affinity glucose transporter HXT2 [Talaromyces islandicus]